MKLPVALRRPLFRVGYRVLSIYWFLFAPPARGVKFLVTRADEVLLVRHTYGPREWEIPGGGIRRGEPSSQAALRELREELGIEPAELTALGQVAVKLGRRRGALDCFQASVASPRIELDRGEIADAGWFTQAALPHDLGKYVMPILGLARGAAAPDSAPASGRGPPIAP